MASGADSTQYSARFLLPDMIERGRSNTLKCPVYRQGAIFAPVEAGSTISIYDADGNAQVNAQPISVIDNVAQYTWTPPATLSYGEGWHVEWTLVILGSTYVFDNEAALVRRALYPVITDADLYRRCSALDPRGTAPISTIADCQTYIDESWVIIQQRLLASGNRPNLILTPASLRETHLCLALALIFEDLSSRLNPAYTERAQSYRRLYEQAWREIRLIYDADDDRLPESFRKRYEASPTYWLAGRQDR